MGNELHTYIQSQFKKVGIVQLTFVVLFQFVPMSLMSKEAPKIYPFEKIYHQGQREFSLKRYDKALVLFTRYIELTKNSKFHKKRLFYVIDQVARIHIRVNKDPDNALKFFNQFKNDQRISEEQFDTIEEWKGVIKDWKKNKLFVTKVEGVELFKKGKALFNSGLKKQSSPDDQSSDLEFSMSLNYLKKFVFEFPMDDNVAEALYMLGTIKSTLATDRDYFVENFYFKELILRFPNSEISWKAWRKLNQTLRAGYTGSSGDNTPPETQRMLERYKKLSIVKKKKSN